MNKAALQKKKRTGAKNGRSSAVADSPAGRMRKLLFCVGSTLALGFVLLLIGSLGAYFCQDPGAVAPQIGIAAAACTALSGGVISAHVLRKSALLCGLCNGCALLAVMLPLSLCMVQYSSHYSARAALLLHLGFLLCSVLGAWLGELHLKKRRPKKHAHKRR